MKDSQDGDPRADDFATLFDDSSMALQQAPLLYRALVEAIPAVTYIDVEDRDSRVGYRTVYVSPQVERLLGHPPEAFIRDQDLWDSLYHPEDADRVRDMVEHQYRSGEIVTMEYRMMTGTGDVLWVRDEQRMIDLGSGRPGLSQGFVVDITVDRTVEQAIRDKEVAEAESRTKVALLSRISHELRTPLNAILGFGQLLEVADLSEEDQDSVGHIVRAGRRLLALVDDVLSVSQLDRSLPQSLFTAEGAAAQRMTILHIDDDALNAALIESILAQRPNVRLVHTGTREFAPELAHAEPLALILLDLDLQDRSGEDVLRELRADPLTDDVPVVVFSANQEATAVERSLAFGASVHLRKPVNATELLSLIDETLSRATQPD